ncbi:MAG: biotin/lipoyl-binding protein, partial [Armatimonadetes bacterium]|nr:biotin/lipoyl-binding protein [Armatimonadota bacterium]
MKRFLYAWAAPAVIAAAVILLAGCGRKGPGESAEAAQTAPTPVVVATAMRGAIEDTLELTGTAQADDEVDVVPEVAGKVTGVYADVGDYVRAGQTLVRLDTQLASAQASQAAAGVTAARAALKQARTARDLTANQTAIAVDLARARLAAAREQLKKAETAAQLTENTVNSNIEQARTALQSAQTALDEIRAGARAQQRLQAQAQVDQAKAALDLAEQTYERNRKLFEGGVIPEIQLDQVRTQYEVAKAQYQ